VIFEPLELPELPKWPLVDLRTSSEVFADIAQRAGLDRLWIEQGPSESLTPAGEGATLCPTCGAYWRCGCGIP